MRKNILISALLLLTTSISAFCSDFGVNLGFNTFRLFGGLSSETTQLRGTPHNGGGLRYIEPGVDLSATMFIDTNLRHRLILGGEYIAMESKEMLSIYQAAYFHKEHTVKFIDAYAGYHFSFWSADWQNVKLFAGPEIMLSSIFENKLIDGLVVLQPTDLIKEGYEDMYEKQSTTRIGARIRAGFEGCIKDNIYITSSFTIGAYNLFMRDDSQGELFNVFNNLDLKEHIQPFFNFIIAFQYRF